MLQCFVNQASGLRLNLGTMELHYGAMLKAERLLMDSNDVLLRPGSQLLLTGTGYGAGQGPGAGKNVSCFLSYGKIYRTCIIL